MSYRSADSRPTVTVEPRDAYELLTSLGAMAERGQGDAFEVGRDWFDGAARAAGDAFVRRLDGFAAGCAWVFGNLLGRAIETPEPRDARALIAHLDSLAARDVHLTLIGHTLRPFRRVTPPELLEAAVDGDRSARRQVQRASFADHPTWPDALRGLLAMPSDTAKAVLLELLGTWSEAVLAGELATIRSIAARDADEKRSLLATCRPEEVIDRATRGWDYVPEPGIERVILAPVVLSRPWNTTADHHDARILCYAVSDESLAAVTGEPPPSLVRRLKALGDERRLRLLRRIRQERLTVQELADELGLPKTTVHHHLVVLRAAGLIHLRDEPGRQYTPFPRYSQRADAIPEAWDALAAYLDLEDH